VANGGTLVTPHVVRAVDNGDAGWTPWAVPPARATVNIRPEHLQAVRDGLWLAVNGAGTAGRARIPGRDVAGKTGTAQVVSITGARLAAGKIDVRDHGFFVFFAPRDNPQIAGIVFAEHAEHGYLAAPIARHVMETFFAKMEGRPLPGPLPGTRAVTTPATITGAGNPGTGTRNPGTGTRNPGTPEPRNP
jgi:penicillin-binding protein 2